MEEQAIDQATTVFEFGPFRYDATRRDLRDAKGPLRVGSRALHLLEILIKEPGKLYSRDELTAQVWPNTVVEETSLRVHISALRRSLGDGQIGARYIANVPGRGYSFVGEVRAVALPPEARADAVSETPQPIRVQLPHRLARPIGRGRDIATVVELLARERLVSIVAAGGMGKTTVALAVAEYQSGPEEHNAIFVDLSTLVDPGQVVLEVGRACRVDIVGGDPWRALESALRERPLLLVLDNCEHVIDAAATLVDRLLKHCPDLRVLVTSREPLELQTEWVVRLPPLGLPPAEQALDIADVRNYPAVQLFVERAHSACNLFELTDANVAAVRQLCEVLNGIPLAIELAAARVASLGVHGLLSRIENAFVLLTRGRRTAMSRHQTLHALLNWSYELLTDTEKRVLQRLSTFRGVFELEDAIAVAADADLSPDMVVDDLLNLCQKSLVVSDAAEDGTQLYRLLYITRLFAERMLALAPEEQAVRRRYAENLLRCVRMATHAASVSRNIRGTSALLSHVADLRAATNWALSSQGDIQLGVDLVMDAMKTWFVAGMTEEYRHLVLLALHHVHRAGADAPRLETRLQVMLTFFSAQALAGSEQHLPERNTQQGWPEQLESTEDKLEAMYAECTHCYGHGHYLGALRVSEASREIARGEFEPISIALSDRLSALTLHALGQHDAAEQLAHRVRTFNEEKLAPRFQSALPFWLSMDICLARIQWLRGEFQASWAAVLTLAALRDKLHIVAGCQILSLAAIPIALWKGNLQQARIWTQWLRQDCARGSHLYWQAYADMYDALLDGRSIDPSEASAQLARRSPPVMDAWSALCQHTPEPAVVGRVQRGEVGWCAPEILRLTALDQFSPASEGGTRHALAGLRWAFDLSVDQGARFWSLRIAADICERAAAGSADQVWAHGQLLSLLDWIDDGSAQPDLERARRLTLAQ